MAPTGLTPDVGWEVGVSRTLPLPAAELWAFLSCAEGLDLWLGRVALPTAPGAPYRTADGLHVSGSARP